MCFSPGLSKKKREMGQWSFTKKNPERKLKPVGENPRAEGGRPNSECVGGNEESAALLAGRVWEKKEKSSIFFNLEGQEQWPGQSKTGVVKKPHQKGLIDL